MTQHRFSTPRSPAVIAHRGSSGAELENSLAAFQRAVNEGSDGVELDIHATRDGALLVHHDPVLPSGVRIAEATLAKLREIPLADGLPAPTLAEVLAVTRGLAVYIEAKSLPAEADGALLEAIRADPDPERLHVHSFDHRIIARLSDQSPSLSLGVLSTSYPVDPVRPVLEAGATTLWQQQELIDQALVTRCARAGIGVIAWTVNDVAEAERLRSLGIAGLCGNWPARLRSAGNAKEAP
jgi:glycerophosphoryl diester phosphodiesterase